MSAIAHYEETFMFKVLYAPFEGVTFWSFGPEQGTPAVLAYLRPSCARVLICVEENKKEKEVPILESVAEVLNCSPSFEFTRLMLRSIRDAWKADMRPKDSKLMQTLRFRKMFGLDQRQPPFAPNNGEREDGYW